MNKCGVFISYSHDDVKYVSPIVRIIKAIRTDLVFQDTVDIKPGQQWEPQLMGALTEAELVIVFWCHHSAGSEYVKKEYETAIEQKKDILPLLLDDCELAAPLAKYQWIDLRTAIFHRKKRQKPEIQATTTMAPRAPTMGSPPGM